jgi:hypothetical protein
LVAFPATGQSEVRVNTKVFDHLSQSVGLRYYISHPDRAPGNVRARFLAIGRAIENVRAPLATPAIVGDRFNKDGFGLPQNEESVAVCTNAPSRVLGGTNDYRGLLFDEGDTSFTGWHFSTNGGDSVTKEGLLPPVNDLDSQGDPVDAARARAGSACDLYAASLSFDTFDPSTAGSSAIAVYKSNPTRLLSAACGDDGPIDPSCWPATVHAATNQANHFLDKPWFAVGNTGDGVHVWVTYSDFVIDPSAPLGFTSAKIFAVRCEADLSGCGTPISISGTDQDVQFSHVTIGPDGRTYITWVQVEGELEQAAQTFTIKLRVADPGSTGFGPTRVVAVASKAIPFGGFLHANDFRVATMPVNTVKMVNGFPRLFVVWDECRYRLLDSVCEEPSIRLRISKNFGQTWSSTKVLSAGGDNYFPTMASVSGRGKVVVAWYTNRRDGVFHNRQDVELVSLNAATNAILKRVRVTSSSNESEADPLLGGFFIGDYIEVVARQGTAYVHYNANYRHVRILGDPQGFSIPQQDNYLTKVGIKDRTDASPAS